MVQRGERGEREEGGGGGRREEGGKGTHAAWRALPPPLLLPLPSGRQHQGLVETGETVGFIAATGCMRETTINVSSDTFSQVTRDEPVHGLTCLQIRFCQESVNTESRLV